MVIKRMSKVRVPAMAREPSKSGNELQGAVEGLLASPLFVKSRRLGSLLSYLAQRSQQGGEGIPSEYDIGIAVFRRDPAVYCTGDDPVVRVQIGRLRRKLADYYATHGAHEPLRLSVPAGGYRLCCERWGAPLADGRPAVLCVRPFSCLTSLGGAFARGLGEELCDLLFHGFERASVRVRLPRGAPTPGELTHEHAYLLEGSVRAEANRVRVAVRLLDVGAGSLLWSARFDRGGPLLIATEQELAEAICHCVIGQFVRHTG
ncbi:hypothetical protein RTH46_18020 [Pseudomonas sp. zfem004]|uniref:hypothetical protein n=1 Tax=unclassified Pseudomonas TaxID=196821 RepID=UPI002115477D|nr:MULTISPECIES: hypothetical protein [unclassified Pseudomonas]MDU9404389.1 hypothetical protein [Pseudomonas sp. zfem004]